MKSALRTPSICMGYAHSAIIRAAIGSGTRSRPRSAFTLLETMLALALGLLLLTAVYAALDQSWRLSASGREEMERAQLARALIHKISLDIRAITYVPPPPTDDTDTTSTTTSGTTTGNTGTTSGTNSGSSGSNGSNNSGSGNNSSNNNSSSGSNSSSSNSSSSSSSDSSDTETPVPNSKSVGLRGTMQQLEISIARPRRDLLPGSSAAITPTNTSDLRAVTYQFLTPGSSTFSGLIRTEGDRMAVEVVEASGNAATMISTVQSVAPEVTALMFRYFDGRIWSETWDSDTMARIPRAVEVTFAFPPPRRRPALFGGGASQSMNTFRTVIVIPVSDPFPKEFAE